MPIVDVELPASLRLERRGNVAVLTLSRPEKRNALNDATVRALGRFFASPPEWVKVVVLDADGAHFSAGLDLSDLGISTPSAGCTTRGCGTRRSGGSSPGRSR